ncbi:MAG: JAB domain-containing protein [Reichenbachiella sp.]|uniref:JAB domain-containing protein n=1 Tax=Reichenbachiella sp. TaxID=2184521 RepID=UPI002967787D|nr:JAB domain-containing protein [Reichenbachiella sp.]MDW3210292.1 JAB domain-containing protein [Reichenbachiella sp.]
MHIEEVKLTYRNKLKAHERPKITCAKDAYEIFLESWDQDQIELIEECKAMFLDRQLRLMSIASISKGGLSETTVDLRLVFAIALKRRANSFILAHNHPSGNLKPSKADIHLTEQFYKAGKLLRIDLEDHLIVTNDGFYSILSEL